ncbi:MAG TPA: potassium-transporting ATPase subunit KdpA [Candidatus Baltobacteraceae bacterium]|jgi:potassium-transporting ATPase potassium-binding subunit|nr:potassium-transporting ATPase subunit KdpA [Candidatus Baltobacteraceae bacterium]
MTANGWFQILLFFAVLLAVTKPLGVFMTRVFSREKTFLDPVLRPIERLIYRCCGIDDNREMDWKEYATAMLLFSVVSMLVLYLIERVQGLKFMPWNPQHFAGVGSDLAFNTAASFTTNTNWQNYGGESTMSYFTQMAGLAYHNFASAGVGIALAIAVIRGIARKESKTIGNFWVDFTRCMLWVLLPACLVIAMVFVSQGMVQNLRPYDTAKLLNAQTVQTTGSDGKTTTQTVTDQVIAQGPIASQEAIKILGTNGGGFLNANSADPFENPTPLTDFMQIVMMLSLGASLTYTLGRMTGSQKHGWAVWSAMAILCLAGVTVIYSMEARGNPLFHGVDQQTTAMQSGGNMEGKEVRFGLASTALFATTTTDASCGAVNGMHDSFTPLGGMVPLVNIMIGEVIFGGVGAGLYGIVVFIVLSVFIAGLMVGRTPEYLGKKIESYDVKMAMITVLIFCLLVLGFTAIAIVSPFGTSSITNPGPHGLSQVLYAYTSMAGNNGSAFAGLNGNTPWYNISGAFDMLFGRFFMVIPVLAMAGNLARKKIVPESAGTFPVTTPLFTFLLISVILIVSALTFFPALSLGPILEHLLMHAGKVF